MAKVPKEFLIRMEGYVAALRFAKQYGIDALEKDIKVRGFLNIPVQIPKKEKDWFLLQISENLTQTMSAVMLYVLYDMLGFRKKRLQRIKQRFDEVTQSVFDFDYMGNHYVKLEDYAIELNETCKLGLDIERIAACQDTCRHEKENIGMARIDDLIINLKEAGYEDAAMWLESRIA